LWSATTSSFLRKKRVLFSRKNRYPETIQFDDKESENMLQTTKLQTNMQTMTTIPTALPPHSSSPLAWEAGDYERIAEAIRWLNAHYLEQPALEELAAHLHLSPFHLQRLFARWAGISPKRFVQYLTVEHAKRMLESNGSVLDASLESGLSGPGRLHDLFVTAEAVTPGEYKSGGLGVEIAWGVHEGPFGTYLLAVTERGICGLTFIDKGAEGALADLHMRWPAARIQSDPAITAPISSAIFPASPTVPRQPIHLLLKGTNFQLQVWRALLDISAGKAVSYEAIAQSIGSPAASRAVGSAVGANAIGYLIPCHRVIRKSGVVEGYAWGKVRKQALLAWESALREQ